ncbi:hypothetical protein BN863_16000 [Formosa agariphila KMM 3901]|uniref:Uncharacterized protein n=1 Tax=Formosa agariphila (strain DSM 15362 / KCTC 12365 / LMG 23005 / KMM 3901 / M-2Alg 35-1) TaxID=1347342 RepID=T2KKA9_FORAG|nr:hypothetical protein [Formosa agariphila]CDF79312.1 hypothetical protein BN863_16000 [Formosa agariphila KMM 3901]
MLNTRVSNGIRVLKVSEVASAHELMNVLFGDHDDLMVSNVTLWN